MSSAKIKPVVIFVEQERIQLIIAYRANVVDAGKVSIVNISAGKGIQFFKKGELFFSYAEEFPKYVVL